MPGADGHRRPEVPHSPSEGAAEDPSYARRPGRLVDELREKTKEPIAFSLNFPELVDQLVVGSEVFIDDGKAAARVVSKAAGRAEIEVYAAREKGVRLKPGKAVNFPSAELDLPPLTSKDFRDLDFVAEHADLIGYSFVQRVDDIELLQDHLVARAPKRQPHGLVLKIETPLAVRNLPRLILQSAAHNPTAVMIARGDLAVELGFARLTEMQEEILWLCEAAHTPVVWATQVLDNYVRDGIASRAEMTDAAMAQGAECVMLDKGPYLAEGVAFLRDVLARMDRHRGQEIRPLRVAEGVGLSRALDARRQARLPDLATSCCRSVRVRKVTLRVAKTQLSRLIEAALAGEEAVIAKGEKPVARLVPIPQGQFEFGVLKPDALGEGPDFFSRWMKPSWWRGRGATDDDGSCSIPMSGHGLSPTIDAFRTARAKKWPRPRPSSSAPFRSSRSRRKHASASGRK